MLSSESAEEREPCFLIDNALVYTHGTSKSVLLLDIRTEGKPNERKKTHKTHPNL